jgi:hypothetical protein
MHGVRVRLPAFRTAAVVDREVVRKVRPGCGRGAACRCWSDDQRSGLGRTGPQVIEDHVDVNARVTGSPLGQEQLQILFAAVRE